jgi:hypothetical protein
MFNLFKKKSEVEKLQEQYEKLMNKYHKLSTVNRTESDKVYAEAQTVLDKIEALEK